MGMKSYKKLKKKKKHKFEGIKIFGMGFYTKDFTTCSHDKISL